MRRSARRGVSLQLELKPEISVNVRPFCSYPQGAVEYVNCLHPVRNQLVKQSSIVHRRIVFYHNGWLDFGVRNRTRQKDNQASQFSTLRRRMRLNPSTLAVTIVALTAEA